MSSSPLGYLKSHKVRHQLVMGTLACILATALGLSIVGAKQNIEDNDQALKLVRAGLDLLAERKIEEGLEKLELANKKSPQICEKMTRGWWDGEEASWKSDNLSPERALKRLEGIKYLRSEENWILVEQSAFREELRRLSPTIQNRENRLKPIGENLERQLEPWLQEAGGGIRELNDSLPAEGELANNLWEQNRKTEAIMHVDRLVALFPWNKPIREMAERLYRADSQPDKIRDLQPQELTSKEIDSLFDSFQTSDGELIAENCKRLEKIIKNHPWCTSAYLIRGQNYIKAKNFPEAIKDANRVLALHPGLAEACMLRAAAYKNTKQYKEQLEDYLTASKQLPFSNDIRSKREEVCDQLKLVDQVISLKNEAIRLEPDRLQLYREKADYLRRKDRLEEAEEVLNRVIPLAQQQRRAKRLLEETDFEYCPSKIFLADLMKDKANIRALRHDYNGAIKIVNEMVATNPKNLKLLDLKTKYLVDEGKFALALKTINEAIASQEGPVTMPYVFGIQLPGNGFDGSSWKALPPGCSVNHDAISRLDTKIQIYQKLKDHDAELKTRRQKLTLERLELVDSDPAFRYFDTIVSAIEISDREIAFELVDRVIRNMTKLDYLDVESFCSSVYETKDPALAIEVLDRLQKNSKTQIPAELFYRARTALLALQTANR